ncbi:DUF4136 domain-containing protein [Spongiimicrobium salis]|uniref:DUF4136 domain-containing protein n=1 Tax=Spongiimicrobium salis TaxID=1667022 RepID=UPI00374CA518
MKAIILVFLSIVFLSCTAIRVNYDYDKQTDFSNYATYNYYPEIDTGLSELDDKRLFKVIDSTMQAKGFLLSEEPDFLMNIQSSTFVAGSRNSVGVGLGSAGRNVGGGISFGVPVGGRKVNRQIIFDLIDTKKDELFWQGSTESAFKENASPLQREQDFIAIVAKVFAAYPPSKN